MTTGLFETVREVSGILNDMGSPWALVGGLAVSAYVEPRFTRDIDVAVAVRDDSAAEAFVADWQARAFQVSLVVEQDETGRLATVRTHRPGEQEGVVVDLLFASSGLEPEIAEEAHEIEIITGLAVPLARPGHLFALKLLSFDAEYRPMDLQDLRHLGAVMDDDEVGAARRGVALIEERGFHRGRDLTELLERHLERVTPR